MSLTMTRAILKEFAVSAFHGDVRDVAIDRVERAIERALEHMAHKRRFWFQQTTTDVVTVVPYSTGTLTVPSSTMVEFSGTTLPSDIVGQFLEIGGERHWYEITTRTDDDTCVTLDAYNGDLTDGTASTAYKIVYPLVNLPANFNKAICLIDPESNTSLPEIAYDAAWVLHSERAGTGVPDRHSFIPKRHDPNQYQLMLYPAPDAQRQYQLVYYRYAGWYNTSTPATSTWARRAPAGTTGDSYYVDWPDAYMHVLEAAVLYMMAREVAPASAGSYKSDLDMVFAEVAETDKRSAKPMYVGRGNRVGLGNEWSF